MDSFNTNQHSDELSYQPTAADWAEYQDWLESQEQEWRAAEISGDEFVDADEYDGQPDEYTEWQDYMGGDDYYDYSNDFYDWE